MATTGPTGATPAAHEPVVVRSILLAATTLALWTGGLLLAGRLFVLLALDPGEVGEPASAVMWRMAHALPPAAAHALAAGVLATAIALALASGRGATPRSGLALLAGAALWLAVLGGWTPGERSSVSASEHGWLALAILVLASFCGSLLTVLLARAERASAAGRALRSKPALLGGVVLALLVPLAVHLHFERRPPTRTVRVRVLDVAFEPEVWRSSTDDPRVQLGVVTPSGDWRADGGDLPGILMPPPAEVRFTVPDAPDGLRLRAAAGVDLFSLRQLQNKDLRAVVRFEIEVDGEQVFAEGIRLGPRRRPLTWKRIPEPGVPVPPGAEVVLRTLIRQVGEEGRRPLPPVKASFGGLVLEREVERPTALASPEAPNVLLIVMDTQRADRMSCYGYPLETTPSVDALAARGLLFEEAYATSSWTWPATASILTGLIPEAHQVLDSTSCYLDGRITTLAEVMGERGYRTAAFSCNPLIVPDKNFDQGFESFDAHNSFRRTDEILDDVLDWLGRRHGERFFLYLHLVDPHWKYEPLPSSLELAGVAEPPEGFPPGGIIDYQKMLMRGAGHGPGGELITDEVVPAAHRDHMNRSYDAAVHTGDHYVGLILAELTRLGLDENTVIAFTSDHGEEILDHGLTTHGLSLHREVTRVPLILAGPSIPVGQRVETRVSNRQLAPTLAHLAGGELQFPPGDPGAFVDHPRFGQPLMLFDPEGIPEEPIFFSTSKAWWKGRQNVNLLGLIEGEWEVHYAPQGVPWGEKEPLPEGDFALYHLPTDPYQHTDLSRGEHAERGRAMIGRMLSHHGEAENAGRSLRVSAGQAAMEYLQAIGYLGSDSDDGSAREQ